MKVTIENHAGRLRLRWQHKGKRYCLACGVDADAVGYSVARIKASEIERDIQAGYLDPKLLKYKPQRLGRNGTDITDPALRVCCTL
jgi:integrase